MPPESSHQQASNILAWYKNYGHLSTDAKHPGFDSTLLNEEYLKTISQLSDCSLDKILSLYSTSFKGLTSKEAKWRLKISGPNEIRLPLTRTRQSTRMSRCETTDSDSFRYSSRSSRLKSSVVKSLPEEILLEYVPTMSLALRDKVEEPVATSELVSGDVIVLKAGMWVPADLYLIRCDGLEVCEHIFGGRKRSFQKEVDADNSETDNFSIEEVKGICWMGSEVINGEGLGVVVETGNRTALGKIMGA